MKTDELIKKNMQSLHNKEYPGRGIIIGRTPDGKKLIQVYWIMGRSANSKNRVFLQEDNNVMIDLFNKGMDTDTSLIVYYPIKDLDSYHIVTNGDQTETVYQALQAGRTFEDALNTREYEPDGPNFTPRISGLIYKQNNAYRYKLSILKSFYNTPSACQRFFYDYSDFHSGMGHCITTYIDNSDPLESFEGEPFLVEMRDSIEENCDLYWNILNQDMLISLCVKSIDVASGEIDICIRNKNQ